MAIVKIRPSIQPVPMAGNEIRSLPELEASLKRANLWSRPLDIEQVAAFLGIRVVREPMENEMSGFLERRDGVWVAGVNAFHHRVRQRFSLAHEIAHYVLHRGQQNEFHDRTFARRVGHATLMEREADQFAAELLMPRELVIATIQQGIRGLNDLSTEFNVSSLAMRYRLQSLGYSLT